MVNAEDWKLTTEFGKSFVPEFARPRLRKYLELAGIYEIPYTLFGFLFYASQIITLIVYGYFWTSYFVKLSPIILLIYTFVYWAIIGITLAFVMMGGVYIYYDVIIFKRTQAMETVLADFLSLFNDNLKTGMTLDKALWRAIKPEFGVLTNEIKIASKRVMTGEDVQVVLEDFVNKYDSITLKRAFSLITESMRGGGELSNVIERVIDDIKKTTALKERMIANSISYTIFITIIVLGIAPMLFSLSYYLLAMIETFSKNILSTPSLGSMMGNIKIAISLVDFTLFSKICLSVIAFFAAMIISIINKGDIRGGVKYIPAFMAGAYLVYTFAMWVLGWAFASFLGSL
ncbi:MAG: type II secretion system F family protein [Candidatus Woesearchaeota archaeon]